MRSPKLPPATDLQLLSVFVTVAETLNLSRAGKRLGLGRAAVSRAILRLEADTGARLFHRSTRRVGITTDGARLYERVSPHVGALQAATGTLRESSARLSGVLRVASPPEIGLSILPEAVASFGRQHPKVRVEVRITPLSVDPVSEGFDVAIRGFVHRLEDSSLSMRRLLRLSGGLFVSPAYLAERGTPRTLADPAHDWILFSGVMNRLVLPSGFSPRIASYDLCFIEAAVLAGAGVGTLPSLLAAPHLASGKMLRVLPQYFGGEVGYAALYPATPHPVMRVSSFCDVLLQTIEARARRGDFGPQHGALLAEPPEKRRIGRRVP